jgi:hypothetical protein
MHVVWHEAVRKTCKLFLLQCAQKLRTNAVDGGMSHEEVASLERTERKEIPMQTEVIERIEMCRSAGEHGEQDGKRSASGPAKAGHYDLGPAKKAGHYDLGPAKKAGHYDLGLAEDGHYDLGPAEAGHYVRHFAQDVRGVRL